MVEFYVREEKEKEIIYNLLSERYHELLNSDTRDEEKFKEIGYLYSKCEFLQVKVSR